MKNWSFKSLFIILFFLLIAIVILLKFILPNQKVSAAWWNDGWSYRKAINIGNSGTAQTNTQVKILDNYDLSALVTAGKLQADLDDLRFTDVNGKVLNYWIEDATNNSVDVWGILTSLPTSGATIYMYYGNSSATSFSSTTNITIGGTMTSIGGYRIHTFKGNGTLTNAKAENAEVLVVAGGGGGGSAGGVGDGGAGGGGGGGLTYNASYALTQGQTINVTVGIGGSASVASAHLAGTDGSNSIFGSITVNGGGGGATSSGNGRSGGSGGGGGYNGYTTVKYGGSGIVGIGNSGGNTTDLASASGAGGGGAGGVGGNNLTGHNGGNGGLGLNYTITGVGVTYASGGRGGGGTGPTNPTANTGKGGDGAYSNATPTSGASGIVVVRYLSGNAASPSTEEIGTAPIAYWKFDEGIGTTAYDSTSNRHNGTLSTGTSTPTWQTEDQCISGKCIFTKGYSTSYIDTNYDYSLSYDSSSTFSFWFKSTTNNTGGLIKNIIGKNSYEILISQLDQQIFFQQWDSVGSNTISLNSSNFITPNTWYFINVIYDSTQHKAFIYINGKFNASQNVTNSDFRNVTETLKIGTGYQWGGSTSPYYTGFIDDVKIYPYSRTAAQIKQDYNSGKAHASSTKGTSANLGNNARNSEAFSEGLVGYWKMDENIGTTTLDSSGNNYTITFNAGSSAPSWVTGKYGVGLSFDGLSNYLSVGISSVPNVYTVSTWIKLNELSREQHFAEFNGTQFYVNSSNKLGTNSWSNASGITTLTTGQWYHAVLTRDSSQIKLYLNGNLEGIGTTGVNPTSPFIIGDLYNNSGNYKFNGLIDEVRIYNRALSPTEVSQLYNWAPGPVGYWDFNEKTGAVANDKSGNNYTTTFGTGNSAPAWSTGKYGAGINLDGSNDYATSTNIPITQEMTWETWYKASTAQDGFLIDHRSSNVGVQPIYTYSTGKIQFYDSTVNTSLETATGILKFDNNWHHVAVTGTATSRNIYFDGISVGSTNTGITPQTTRAVYFGTRHSLSSFFKGQLDDIRIYNYARSVKQIVEDMNAGHPAGGSPVGSQLVYYKFDEGIGTTTSNWGIGGTNLKGTFGAGASAPTWSNDGKYGKALSFNGAGNYVITPSVAAISQTTWSIWIKPNNTNEMHIIKSNDASDYMLANTSGKAFKIRTFSGSGDIFTTSGLLPTNSWSQLVMVYTNPGIKLYLNGRLDKQSSTYTMGSLNSSYQLGRYGGVEPDFNGLMDEFKIYNYALTDDEVKIDYNRGSTMQMGSLSSGTGNTAPATAGSQEYCIPGDTSVCSPPVGEWKFDEKSGATARDTSGLGNTGTFGTGNSAPTWTTGKIGSGLNFDGSNDSVGILYTADLAPTSSITFEAWAYKPSWTSAEATRILSKTESGGYTLLFSSSAIYAYIYRNGAYCTPSYSTTGLSSGWHHFAGSYDGRYTKIYVDGILRNTDDAGANYPITYAYNNTLFIGAEADSNNDQTPAGNFFTGKIDQVKIFNYARTPAQIAWDYNRGGPVGWWKFDECQGNIAQDWSGIGNTGVISIGTSGIQNSLGTCAVGTSAAWTAGASGKINSSLSFDGNDDNVNMGDPSNGTLDFGLNDFTTVAWFKTSTTNQGVILGKYSGYPLFYSRINSDGKIGSRIGFDASTNFESTDGTVVNDNLWHQIVTVYKRNGNMTRYLDGKLYGSTLDISSASSRTVDTTNSFAVSSSGSSQFFTGQIDDVRVYNYALTATQVKTLYNNGAVSFN